MGRSSRGGSISLPGLRSARTVSAVAAVLLALVSWVVYRVFTPFTLLPIGVAVGFGTYTVFGSRHGDVLEWAVDDPRTPGVLTASFLASLAVGVFSLRNAYYGKPIAFYGAVAIAAGLLVLRILLTDAHATNGLLAFLFGVTTFVSNQLAFPLGLNGPDSGFHRRFAARIFETGVVPGVGGTEPTSTQYVGYPLQHVLSASAAHVTGLPVGQTYRTLAIAGMLLVLPLSYLAARRFGSEEFALLTVLFVASMEYVVYRAGHPSKLAHALPLLVLSFTAALYVYRRRGTPGVVLLFGLFSTALVFSHAHTAFVALILMVSLAAGSWLGAFAEPPLARVFSLGKGEGGQATGWDRPRRDRIGGFEFESGTSGTDSPIQTAIESRLHVMALVFVVAFLAQAVYFSGFYGNVVEILVEWVEAILLATEGTTQQAPRFGSLPTDSILINTIGSGLLAALVVLGILDLLEHRNTVGFVLATWLLAAGGLMVVGVVGDAQFALPNRVYVIAQLTAMGFFAAAGVLYLFGQTSKFSPHAGRVVGVCVLAILVGFVFFSTASTIAGPGTSPFNDDVPHRMWTGMVEQDAADEFAGERITADNYRAASSFPMAEDGSINYDGANGSEVVYVNEFRLSTGVTLQGGPGQIGGAIYVIPRTPRAGLVEKSNRVYDNGAVEFYQVRRAEADGIGEADPS